MEHRHIGLRNDLWTTIFWQNRDLREQISPHLLAKCSRHTYFQKRTNSKELFGFCKFNCHVELSKIALPLHLHYWKASSHVRLWLLRPNEESTCFHTHHLSSSLLDGWKGMAKSIRSHRVLYALNNSSNLGGTCRKNFTGKAKEKNFQLIANSATNTWVWRVFSSSNLIIHGLCLVFSKGK